MKYKQTHEYINSLAEPLVRILPNYSEYQLLKHKISEYSENPVHDSADSDNLTYSTSSSDVKLFFYTIYDDVLGKSWGSQKYHIAKLFSNYILWNNMDLLYIDVSLTDNKYFCYDRLLTNLFNFINVSTKKFCVCQFGTETHATSLHLTKISDTVIELCYINTGFGIDDSYSTVNLEDNKYYDLFKKTCFKKEDTIKFLKFIQPFIFYQFNKNSDFSFFDFCMNNVTIYPHDEIMPDYTNIYKILYQYGKYFNEINNIFASDNYYIFDKNLHINHTFNDNSIKFITLWKSMIQENSTNNSKINYFNKAVKSLKYVNVCNKIFYYPQESGSCTFKSIFMAWIYNTIIDQSDLIKSKIDNYFFIYCESNYRSLTNINKLYHDSCDDCDTLYLMDLLSKDDIIQFDYSDSLIKTMEEPINFIDDIGETTKIIHYCVLCDKSKLYDTISKIRNNNIDSTYLYDEHFLFYFKKYGIVKEYIYTPMIIEYTMLVLLYEYYYNKKGWDDEYLIDTLNERELISFRFELLKHEELWISKIIMWLYCESNNVKKIILLNDIKFTIQFNLFKCYHSDIVFSNTQCNESLLMTSFIKEMLFNVRPDKLVYFKDNDTKIDSNNKSKITDDLKSLCYTNELAYRNILIDYLKKNFNNFYNILTRLSDYTLIIKYSEFLIQFLKANLEYVGIKETQYIIVSLLKIYIDIEKNNISDKLFPILIHDSINFFNHDYYVSLFRTNVNLRNEIILSVFNFNYQQNSDFFFNDKPIIKIASNENQLINILNTILTDDYDECIENITKYKFDVGITINNKNVIIVTNTLIIYNGDNYTKIKVKSVNNILINSLVKNDTVLTYINKTKNNLIIILSSLKYNYIHHDYILSFNINYSKDGNYVIDTNTLKINNQNVIMSNDIKKYPFLIFVPATSINFIMKNKNNYKLIIIKNNDIFKKTSKFFSHAVFDDLFLPSFYLELPINNNFLTILFTMELYKKYEQIVKYCNNKYLFIQNKFKINKHKLSEIDISSNKLNLKIIDDIKKSTTCITDICKILKKELLLEDTTDINLNDTIIFNNIFYDTRNCMYCPNKENLNINYQKNIYYEKITDTKIREKAIITFIKNNPYCSMTNSQKNTKLQQISERLKYYIPLLFQYRNKLLTLLSVANIYSSEYTLVNFISDNYECFSQILQINLYINQLTRITEIIDNNTISCNEILEINQLLVISTSTPSNLLENIIEILLGINIKKEQWEKYSTILKNYQMNDRWQVHHFAMGKGKSSVITPLLTITLAQDCNINIVVPTHLLKQTKETLFDIISYFSFNLNIYDDVTVKQKFLQKKLNTYNEVFLIDEFDFMYNPLQGNFNSILETHSMIHTVEKEDTNNMTVNKLENILLLINNFLKHNTINPYSKYSMEAEIYAVLNNKEKYIKNVTYGMSYINKNNRYCIPYQRHNSPLENSSFKSNLMTIVLTILYFLENNYVLEEDDIYILCFKNNKHIKKLLCEYYVIDPLLFNGTNFENIKKIYNSKIYLAEDLSKRYNIFKEYLKIIASSIKESILINNCSFFDIMGINSKWQVGYSGTTNLNILDCPSLIKYSPEIIPDYDEIIGTYLALTGNYSNSKNNYHKIINTEQIFNFYKKDYDVLIDACAYLKDYDNSFIAKQLHIFSGKYVIYLLKDDSKRIIKDGKDVMYDNTIYYNNQVIYYYSQRHIVGIDFKQPNILNGLVLIDDSNNYTQIAQAVYRMRKLNRGHRVNIGYCGKKKDMNKQKVYDYLVDNDKIFLQSVKNLTLLQMLKYAYRKFVSNNYRENFLDPLYKFTNITDSNILNVIYENFSKNILSIYTGTYKSNVFGYCNILKSKKLTDGVQIELNALVQSIIKLDINSLLELFYDINSAEYNLVSEVELLSESEQETQKLIQINYNDYEKQFLNFSIKYYYNPFSTFVNNYYNWCSYVINDITVIFSINIFTVIQYDKLTLCLIRLEENKFLIENVYNIDFYFDILPIYTLDGYLLNINSVPEIHKFSNDIFDFNLIDTDKLLNCKIVNDDSHIIISNIINNNNPSNCITTDGDDFIKFKLVMNYIYKFANIDNTSKIESLSLSDLDILYLTLNSYYVEPYQNYIGQLIINKLNKSTITNLPADSSSKLKHPVQLYCVYVVKNNINIIKKITLLSNYSDPSNQSNMAKKYLKYKKKYLELKMKIKTI
jgi:hypothetical protein